MYPSFSLYFLQCTVTQDLTDTVFSQCFCFHCVSHHGCPLSHRISPPPTGAGGEVSQGLYETIPAVSSGYDASLNTTSRPPSSEDSPQVDLITFMEWTLARNRSPFTTCQTSPPSPQCAEHQPEPTNYGEPMTGDQQASAMPSEVCRLCGVDNGKTWIPVHCLSQGRSHKCLSMPRAQSTISTLCGAQARAHRGQRTVPAAINKPAQYRVTERRIAPNEVPSLSERAMDFESVEWSSAPCTVAEVKLMMNLGRGEPEKDLIDWKADLLPLLPPSAEPYVKPVPTSKPE